MKGTLIYGDGKTLLELTEKSGSLVDVLDNVSVPQKQAISLCDFDGPGEILDPKCYFGVMKPGEGKIHKSCAIRCLSGGIPPVFRAPNVEKDGYEYYLMLDQNGKKLGKEILPFVGENVRAGGKEAMFENWKILYVNANNIIYH